MGLGWVEQPVSTHPPIMTPTPTPTKQQVADLNIKTEGPVGNGKVICFSVYGGPEVDFGHGKGTVRGTVCESFVSDCTTCTTCIL